MEIPHLDCLHWGRGRSGGCSVKGILGPLGESALGKEEEVIWGQRAGPGGKEAPFPATACLSRHQHMTCSHGRFILGIWPTLSPQFLKMQVILGRLCAGVINTPWAWSGEKRVA